MRAATAMTRGKGTAKKKMAMNAAAATIQSWGAAKYAVPL